MDAAAVKGLVLDMDGVFYVGDELVAGAGEALSRLREMGIPFRFITNTTTRTPQELIDKLDRLGLQVRSEEIFTAISATEKYLSLRHNPSCYLLVRESVKGCFAACEHNEVDPDFVVVGDIGANWDYQTLNRIFNMLMSSSRLICMHRNKYWQTEEGLRMDIGAFVAALEYVTGQEAIVIGKPSPAFFQLALASLDLPPEQVAIVGDDIDSDVGGGQAAGLQGILVKTGKYRQDLAARSSVRPDAVIASIADLPALLKDR